MWLSYSPARVQVEIWVRGVLAPLFNGAVASWDNGSRNLQALTLWGLGFRALNPKSVALEPEACERTSPFQRAVAIAPSLHECCGWRKAYLLSPFTRDRGICLLYIQIALLASARFLLMNFNMQVAQEVVLLKWGAC